MSYDIERLVLLYTRRAGSVPEIYASSDALDRFNQCATTGRMTLVDWSKDTDNEETFDVDMAALAVIEDIARPGVDRGNGKPIGAWQRSRALPA